MSQVYTKEDIDNIRRSAQEWLDEVEPGRLKLPPEKYVSFIENLLDLEDSIDFSKIEEKKILNKMMGTTWYKLPDDLLYHNFDENIDFSMVTIDWTNDKDQIRVDVRDSITNELLDHKFYNSRMFDLRLTMEYWHSEPELREKITNIAPKYVTEVIDPIMKKLNWKPIFI